ncbi:hypothetical protein SAMN05216548_108105 [Faunimonas pinastri]|uniref:OpgC protein n=1 Tax=Faunimonas pinastri TaxID=1855383 RepID=A0A1H9JF34_9HYPH|nr:OpgC domain-containing protein [Faunimonas pinastri]SEQ85611.1 hypothetical protein SAMN05216548_108105 [Faunimonas pinastri]
MNAKPDLEQVPSAPIATPDKSAAKRVGRILSFDFWRGLALITIFINHIPGNPLERFTSRNFGFSDASEVFVFLAGAAAGLAYFRRFQSGQRLLQTLKIWMRSFHLYSAHIVLVIAMAAIMGFAAQQTGDVRLLEMMHFDVFVASPVQGLIGLATLGLQPSYLNILPLYIVLIAVSPVLILIASKSVRWMLALSGALYVGTQLLALKLPSYPLPDGWFFNPLAWQFIFAIGLAVGISLVRGAPLPRNRLLFALAAFYTVMACIWIKAGFYIKWDLWPLPRFMWEFDKTNLLLPRLLHVLALAYLASYLPMERWLRSTAYLRPVILMGQHSLPVFCFGTVLSLVGQILRMVGSGDPTTDVVMIVTGILLQMGLAGVLEWYRVGLNQRPQGQVAASAG